MKHKAEILRSALLARLTLLSASLLIAGSVALAQINAPVRPPETTSQAPQKTGFRAVSYEVFASLAPESQMLTARAIVEFQAQEASRIIECQLHPNLTINDVRDPSGNVLELDRSGENGLDVTISLPNVVPAGQSIKLTFQYAGVLSGGDNSPGSGVTLASIGKDGAYLLLPARWFPLTDYPANRYTGVFHIDVPQSFLVIGTGTSEAPAPSSGVPNNPAPMLGNRNPEGGNRPGDAAPPRLARRNQDDFHRGDNSAATATSAPAAVIPGSTMSASGPRVTYTFRIDQPEAAGTFVAGALQLSPVQAEGLNISVYVPASASSTAQEYGGAVAKIVNTLSDQFGPLPKPNLTIAQLPDGTVPAYSAPGLLLLSQRQWGPAA